jgi:hypothetical protein
VAEASGTGSKVMGFAALNPFYAPRACAGRDNLSASLPGLTRQSMMSVDTRKP